MYVNLTVKHRSRGGIFLPMTYRFWVWSLTQAAAMTNWADTPPSILRDLNMHIVSIRSRSRSRGVRPELTESGESVVFFLRTLLHMLVRTRTPYRDQQIAREAVGKRDQGARILGSWVVFEMLRSCKDAHSCTLCIGSCHCMLCNTNRRAIWITNRGTGFLC